MSKLPVEIFAEIRSSVPVELDNAVLHILEQHQGKENRVSRLDLVEAVFGPLPVDVELASSTQDRLVREAVARLQEIHPILASSGFGGYYYAQSMDEVNAYVGEILSRANKLFNKASRLERIARKTFDRAQQMTLGLD